MASIFFVVLFWCSHLLSSRRSRRSPFKMYPPKRAFWGGEGGGVVDENKCGKASVSLSGPPLPWANNDRIRLQAVGLATAIVCLVYVNFSFLSLPLPPAILCARGNSGQQEIFGTNSLSRPLRPFVLLLPTGSLHLGGGGEVGRIRKRVCFSAAHKSKKRITQTGD